MISSDTANGEIVSAASDAKTVVSNTYSMTAAQYTAWALTTDTLPVAAAANKMTHLTNTSINDPYFQFFYCGGSRDHIYNCYKLQPSSSTDGNPRFDKDSSGVKALYYTSGSAVSTKDVTLTGALMGASTASIALVAGVLALSF